MCSPPQERPTVLQLQFTNIGPTVDPETQSRLLNFRVWLPGSTPRKVLLAKADLSAPRSLAPIPPFAGGGGGQVNKRQDGRAPPGTGQHRARLSARGEYYGQLFAPKGVDPVDRRPSVCGPIPVSLLKGTKDKGPHIDSGRVRVATGSPSLERHHPIPPPGYIIGGGATPSPIHWW